MHRILESIFQPVTWAAIITLSLSFIVNGQEQDRIIDWQTVRLMSDAKVLEIVEVKVNGKSITIGQPFTADDHWLDTLSFKVRNISDKTINLFGFGVAFPEINANKGPALMFSVTYGANRPQDGSIKQKPLMPNEEVDLRLPEDQLKIMRDVNMNMNRTSNLSKVNILPALVTFEDGSRVGGISLRKRVIEKP